jgi:hypothetical protein
MKQILLLALALIAAGPIRAESAERRGDTAWRQRDRGFSSSGRVDPAPATQAVAAYEEALAEDAGNVELRLKLLEALYFRGHFATDERAVRKRTFERMVALAEETVDLVASRSGGASGLRRMDVARRVDLTAGVADAVPAHFWAAIAWGVWGLEHGYAASATHGVAGRIRDHAEIVARLDPLYRDGGGHRLLGRLHTATPKVPLVTGWIDRRRGIEHLEKALATSDDDARNALFLGEALLRYVPAERARAIDLLRSAAERTPDPDRPVEDRETIDSARRALATAMSKR